MVANLPFVVVVVRGPVVGATGAVVEYSSLLLLLEENKDEIDVVVEENPWNDVGIIIRRVVVLLALVP